MSILNVYYETMFENILVLIDAKEKSSDLIIIIHI